jgi:hypothetical protein
MLASTLLAGCGVRSTASGVEPGANSPVLRFKPCDQTQGVRRLRLVDPKGKIVWTATARSGGEATTVISVAPSLAGYDVVDRLGPAGLAPGTTYRALTDATDGTAWPGPTFDPADLRPGKVLVAGRQLDAAKWRADEPSCKGRSWGAVALSALLAGGGAAAVMGLVLGPLWLLRRAALRRARERQGHLPWLHDPPPDQGFSLRLPHRRRPR